jgi:hypothetical protein
MVDDEEERSSGIDSHRSGEGLVVHWVVAQSVERRSSGREDMLRLLSHPDESRPMRLARGQMNCRELAHGRPK